MRIRLLSMMLLALIGLGSAALAQVQAFSPASARAVGTLLRKGSNFFEQALSPARIEELAKIAAKPGGTKLVGEELARMKLPNEVLEDTFARMLVVQGHVSEREADGWIRRLGGVEGFRAALRKSTGASPANTIGHLHEVRIADNAVLGNFKVRGIGVPFKDPNKKGLTDIDVLLEKNGRLIAIEAKDYPAVRKIPIANFRADMVTLAEYRAANRKSEVLTVFSITNKPVDPDSWKLLQSSANQHNVKLLVGSPTDLMHQIPILLP